MALASTILMIRPAAFGANSQTASTNYFQSPENTPPKEIHSKALKEFDTMVQALRDNHLHVIVIDDTADPIKPSAAFPNNWLSTSPDGGVYIYPMFAPNRRPEKRDDILKYLNDNYRVTDVQDWSEYEVEGKFLEGTGSMIFDHENKVIFACHSKRTNISLLEKFANSNGYRAIVFLATDENGYPVYHTNIVMAMGEKFAILCEEAIDEEWELIAVKQLLDSCSHEIISITRKQMHAFAGNVLNVQNGKGEKILVLSQAALTTLTGEQIEMLNTYSKLLPISVPTFETVEGGSVRCMMAEIFLEKK